VIENVDNSILTGQSSQVPSGSPGVVAGVDSSTAIKQDLDDGAVAEASSVHERGHVIHIAGFDRGARFK
jgi:hypothetical protein